MDPGVLADGGQIAIAGDSAWNIQRKIEAGDIDLGLINGKVPEGLDSHHILREEVVACVHRFHPLAKNKKCPIRDLLGAYRDHEDLISIGAYRRGANKAVDAAIDMQDAINAYLRQPVEQPATLADARDGLLRLYEQYRQRMEA